MAKKLISIKVCWNLVCDCGNLLLDYIWTYFQYFLFLSKDSISNGLLAVEFNQDIKTVLDQEL